MSETPGDIQRGQEEGGESQPAPEQQSMQQQATPFEIAVLPLQNTTLFPETVVPLAVGRTRSMASVEAALSTEEKLLACISVRTENETGAEARPADLYNVGTLVMIKRMMRSTDGLQLIVHGTERVRVVRWTQTDPHIRARVRILPRLHTQPRRRAGAADARSRHGRRVAPARAREPRA